MNQKLVSSSQFITYKEWPRMTHDFEKFVGTPKTIKIQELYRLLELHTKGQAIATSDFLKKLKSPKPTWVLVGDVSDVEHLLDDLDSLEYSKKNGEQQIKLI
jgi:hypothetical protein